MQCDLSVGGFDVPSIVMFAKKPTALLWVPQPSLGKAGMGLFDFLRKLFASAPTPRSQAGTPGAPAPQAPAPQTNWPPTNSVEALREARTRLLARALDQVAPPAPVITPRNLPTEPRNTTLNLDAGLFQPLPADRVRKTAMASTFSGWWEFGRRDRIPSPIDPRTKLIDQAMVGQGLVSPEDLVRLHDIGQQMDELRPQLAGAHVLADRAVQANREELKRIKEQKKAAAEQRRRDHTARVTANKLSDIIHLGRGVSMGLADRRSNVEKLQQRGLPVLATPADVAHAMGLAVPKLRWLAYHAEASAVSHYVQFVVPKKSGGERTLSAPHQQMADAQRWVLENILQKLPAHHAAHGFVKDRSILTNAKPHVGSAVIVNCDLTDFFPSITVHRVIGMFRQVGYSPAVATVIALLVTDCPRRKVLYQGKPWHVATGPRGLPQGACTSPAISNQIARRMDSRLVGIANKLGWTFTRYADDLTFSSAMPNDRIGYLLARIRHITSDEGFAINEKKTRVLKPAARQSVTGVVVNTQPSTSRRTRRQLRAILYNAKRTGVLAQNRTRRKDFRGWLVGMIGFVAMVNPRQAVRLRQELAELQR